MHQNNLKISKKNINLKKIKKFIEKKNAMARPRK
jgi:hypothetical protein